MTWQPPQLKASRIVVTEPAVVADPTDFLSRWLDSTAIAVVERHADVQIVPLDDVIFDDHTVSVHAFAEGRLTDVRVVRVGEGWLVDAVREGANVDGARPVWARPGRHLCLGKATPAAGHGTVMREARIRPYSLPVAIPTESNACVDFVDYYAENAVTGDLHCIAHRVVAIRSLPHA
jgi:hypothetical protein